MTTIAEVRALIPDPVQFDRTVAVGDGASVDYEIPNTPAVAGSAKVYKDLVLQTIATHYAIDDAMGLVTFVAAPASGAAIVITYKHTMLSDEQITLAIAVEGDDVRLATAQALEMFASNTAIIEKRIRVLDLSTDGPAVARELRERAGALREQESAAAGFEIAEWVPDVFSARERVFKQAQREDL